MKLQLASVLALAVVLSGCRTYVYRIVKPPGAPPVVSDRPVVLRYDPLEYRLSRQHDRLLMAITNPTDDRIALLGNRSFVVDPEGESHPLRGWVLGPHSYTRMLLPPVPLSIPYPDYSAWGWGWGMGWPGWYDPLWGPMYGGVAFAGPTVSYAQIQTVYDWTWKEGPARLRLSYERNTSKFEHDFEFVREPAK